MFCPNCACELPAVAKFCVRCGSRQESSSAVQSVQNVSRSSAVAAVRTADLDSKKAEFPDFEVAPPHLYATGKKFVVPRDAILPSLCIKCGNAPTEPWLKKSYSWHNPLVYLLLISPVVYLIVALIVRKKIKLAVPLCSAHRSIRKKRLWLSIILLLGCIPLPVAMAAYIGTDAANTLALWLGLGMFVAGVIFYAYVSPIRPTHIWASSAEFTGACPEFLASLSPSPR
jgi:hypothetical protein